jgi:hypothetical protein
LVGVPVTVGVRVWVIVLVTVDVKVLVKVLVTVEVDVRVQVSPMALVQGADVLVGVLLVAGLVGLFLLPGQPTAKKASPIRSGIIPKLIGFMTSP